MTQESSPPPTPGPGLTRRRLLQSGLALAAASCGPSGDGDGENGRTPSPAPGPARAPGASPRRPNVLFVFGDAHRASALGCYGNTQLHTPAFDSLARDGLRLTTAVSSTPLCKPYRASLMTGRHAHHTGVLANRSPRNTALIGEEMRFDPRDAATLGGSFSRAGYRCGYVGKWHLGPMALDPGPQRLGFDDFWAVTDQPVHRYDEWTLWHSASESSSGRGRFTSEVETDEALRFIEQSDERPWLLVLSWGPPHEPFEPPPGFRRRSAVTPPPNVPEGAESRLARNSLPSYYGLVEALDAQMARLLEALSARGIADDTLVVYTSDHGTMIGSHGYGGKELPFAESTSIPLLARWPAGLPAGSLTDLPFGTVDVLPTLAGLCGAPVDGSLDGSDRSAALRAPAPTSDELIAYLSATECKFAPWPGWRGLRTARHLFARREDGPWLLHDLLADPWGLDNLVETRPELLSSLDERLTDEMGRLGDSWRG